MPLETMPAHRIRLKTFNSVGEFNDWISKQKGIVLVHLACVYQGRGKKRELPPQWAILATYYELERVKK
ncbi:hypothetical protein ES703_46416 [subsurface metagenome]